MQQQPNHDAEWRIVAPSGLNDMKYDPKQHTPTEREQEDPPRASSTVPARPTKDRPCGIIKPPGTISLIRMIVVTPSRCVPTSQDEMCQGRRPLEVCPLQFPQSGVYL